MKDVKVDIGAGKEFCGVRVVQDFCVPHISQEFARIFIYEDYISTSGLVAPSNQPTLLTFTSVTSSGYTVSWTASVGGADGYVVFRRTGASPTYTPVDGTTYVVDTVYGDSTCEYFGSAVTFNESGLSAYIEYFYDVFAYNGTAGTYKFLTTSPLENSQRTLFDFGNAIHSDGSNDVITGIVNSVLGGSASMVCEFWFKNDTATFVTTAILFGSFNSGATLGWGVTGISGGRSMRFQIFNGSNVYGTYTPASITSKTHVRVVFDGAQSTNATRLRVWFNGVEVTLSFTGTIPATIGSSGQPIRFCRFTTALAFYDGWLDEFCLWDNATGSDTYNGGTGAPPSSTGLIRHLKFNESNPVGTLTDETGNDTFTGTNFNNDSNSGLGPLT